MYLKELHIDFTICKLEQSQTFPPKQAFTFLSYTDDELSCVCPSKDTPLHVLSKDEGWICFKIDASLDFTLIGVIAPIAAMLAEAHIGIFIVSTFNTDYILIKKGDRLRAIEKLTAGGYHFS